MSWKLAEPSPAPLAGIIGVGAGLPDPAPDWASLREDPKFQEIIESMGSH